MKKIFSMPLYLQGLKRARAAGVASAVVFLVLNSLPILTVWVLYITDLLIGGGGLEDVTVKAEYAMIPSYIIILLAPIIVMRMFSFLNKRSSSDFYHAIPQKRICVYTSFMAAALTWIIVPVIVGGVMCFIGWNLIPSYWIGPLAIARCVISYTALGLLSAGCMTFAVMLTGNAFSCIFAYINVLCMPFAVINIYSHMVATIEDTFVLDRSVFRYVGGKGFLPVALGDYFFSPISPAVILAFVAFFALLVLAGVAYVKRKSETAENSTCNRFLQHLLRCCSILPIWLFLGWLVLVDMGSTWFVVAAIFIPISVVVYVLYELITTRRLINVAKSLLVYIVVPAVSVVLALCALVNAWLIPLTNPQSIDEVSYVVVSGDSYSYLVDSNLPYQILYGEKIYNSEIVDAVTSGLSFRSDASDEYDSYEKLSIMLKLKNGRTVWRYAYLNSYGMNSFVDGLAEEETYREKMLALPDYNAKGVQIEVSEQVWQSFVKEYNALTYEQKMTVYESYYGTDEYYIINASVPFESGATSLTESLFGTYDSLNLYYYVSQSVFPETYKLCQGYFGQTSWQEYEYDY